MELLQPLCSFCNKIDFETQKPAVQWPLGDGWRIQQSSCPLCRLVVHAWNSNENLLSDKRQCLPNQENVVLEGLGRLFIMRSEQRGQKYDTPIFREESEPDPGSDIVRSSFLADTPAEIDFAQILSRICGIDRGEKNRCYDARCRHQPPEAQTQVEFPGLKTLRLIDVLDIMLAEFSINTETATSLPRYVALSYVWGAVPTARLSSASLSLFARPGGMRRLLSMLPRTILDAITAVQKLGLRYLWVDSLCLVQNDEEDLQLGIRVMDIIYQSAYLVLVAADGHDANAGLPGVTYGSRAPRINTWPITPRVRLGIFPSLEAYLRVSAYQTRGWTFQEYRLAERALVFVKGRLFYRCRGTYWPENSTRVADIGTPTIREQHRFEMFKFPDLVEDYSARQFTNEGDVLKAVQGIFRCLFQDKDSYGDGHLQGLRLKCFSDYLFFGAAKAPLRRRPQFPSYSWAGWRGRVKYRDVIEAILSSESGGGWVQYHILDSDDNIVVLDNLQRRMEPKWVFFSPWLYTHHPTNTVFPQDANPESKRVMRQCQNQRAYPLLHFWTFVLHAQLADVDPIAASARVRCDGKYIGEARLDGFEESLFFNTTDSYEFLILRRCIRQGFGLFEVMLIQRIGTLAERRGVATLDMVATQSQAAAHDLEWQEILLA
jgi:hypothetical protein